MLQVFQLFRAYVVVFHLNVVKVDLMLHILQWDPYTVAVCYSYWAYVHARGSRGGMSGKRKIRSVRRSRHGPVWACVGMGTEAVRTLREVGAGVLAVAAACMRAGVSPDDV